MITPAPLLARIVLFSSVEKNVFRPTTSEEILKLLKVHDGFEGNVFARNIGNARMIAVADDGDATRAKNVTAVKEGALNHRLVACDLDASTAPLFEIAVCS
jgi:hypothetical protein